MESSIRPSTFNQSAKSSTQRSIRLDKPKGKILSKVFTTKGLLAVVAVLQVVILGLLIVIINPAAVFEQLDAVRVINLVSRQVSVPPSEVPVIARVGDNKLLPNLDTLKSQNEVNAQVYKDARDGDYVLGFTSKLVIYRLADNKIIYEGDNPQKILENTQKAIVENVVKKAKERGLIQNDSDETPQVAVVTDPNALRQANPEFYRDAQQNDILAT